MHTMNRKAEIVSLIVYMLLVMHLQVPPENRSKNMNLVLKFTLINLMAMETARQDIMEAENCNIFDRLITDYDTIY